MERNVFRSQFWAAFDAFIPGAEDEIGDSKDATRCAATPAPTWSFALATGRTSLGEQCQRGLMHTRIARSYNIAASGRIAAAPGRHHAPCPFDDRD